MPRIGVILNANARKNRRHPGLARALADVVGGAGEVVVTESLDELPAVVERMLERDVDVLAAAGGDGALHHVANAILARRGALSRPSLLPTNGGTIDFVAKRVGIRGHTVDVVTRAARALRDGAPRTVTVQTLALDGEGDGDGGWLSPRGPFRRVGFALAAGGVGQRFFEQFYGLEDPSPVGVAQVIARVAISQTARTLRLPVGATVRRWSEQIFAPTLARVAIDGERIDACAHSLLHAGAFDIDLGGVLRVFPLAAEPGALHFHAGAASPWDLLQNVPRIVTGRLLRGDGVIERRGSHMCIEALDEPLAPVVDGEVYTGVRRLEVSAGPALTIAVV